MMRKFNMIIAIGLVAISIVSAVFFASRTKAVGSKIDISNQADPTKMAFQNSVQGTSGKSDSEPEFGPFSMTKDEIGNFWSPQIVFYGKVMDQNGSPVGVK